MTKKTKSFFERLTGNSHTDDAEEEVVERKIHLPAETNKMAPTEKPGWLEDDEGGQLTIDMFQTPSEIVIQAMIAGVKPENLDVSITQDMVTIKGRRQQSRETSEENYYYKELYWGSFTRSILLPQEVDSEEADASLKNGLLIIKLPKVDKSRTQKLAIKTS